VGRHNNSETAFPSELITLIRDALKAVAGDPRALGLLTERDKERLYGVFLIEKENKDREKASKKREECIAIFNKILRVPFLVSTPSLAS
jgi:hypothetical protein